MDSVHYSDRSPPRPSSPCHITTASTTHSYLKGNLALSKYLFNCLAMSCMKSTVVSNIAASLICVGSDELFPSCCCCVIGIHTDLKQSANRDRQELPVQHCAGKLLSPVHVVPLCSCDDGLRVDLVLLTEFTGRI